MNNKKQSIDEQQKLDKKLSLINEMSSFKRWSSYFKLSKDEKLEYKEFKKSKKNSLIEFKKTFDKKNIFEIDNFNFWYQNKQALFDINTKIKRNKVTALIGPSGCGKSTFLRCLNKMNDQITGVKSSGNIFFDNGVNLKSKSMTPLELTTRVGMVFQKPSPFPMSIYENVAYGPKSHGIKDKKILDKIVAKSLKGAALWEEVKNNLFDLGTSLSGGQQQRLCIARAIALEPEVLLMDEPTSGLDPIATSKIENLINDLKKKFTIIIVTHSMAQAQRVSDETFFFYQGKLIESGTTKQIFISPNDKKTKEYITGRIG